MVNEPVLPGFDCAGCNGAWNEEYFEIEGAGVFAMCRPCVEWMVNRSRRTFKKISRSEYLVARVMAS